MNRALKLFRTNYGRADGWDIVHDGNSVGRLVDPRYADMFWVRYRIIPNSPDDLPKLHDPANWAKGAFRFRSVAMDEFADHPYAALGSDPAETETITMRALYLVSVLKGREPM